VENLSDLRGLSLEECGGLRRSGLGWTIGSAAEGAASSIAVTGAELSTDAEREDGGDGVAVSTHPADDAAWCGEFPIGSDEVEDVVQVDEELEAEIEGDQGSESA
jgi:hypothetical protein